MLAPSALEFSRQLMEAIEPAERAVLGRALAKLAERSPQIADKIANDIALGRIPG